MGRSPCCDKNGLKKGPWTPEEDKKLLDYIQEHGHGSWISLPKRAGLNRCGKSCRLRWINYLRPDIKRGNFSAQEEETILRLHCILGNKWSSIAARLPGRTDNEIKNYWNTHLKKKLIRMGLDPVTHQPRTDLFSGLQNLLALASLRNLMSHPPLDENNSLELFQADQAVQMANKLQQLQEYLLQSIPLSAQNNISIQDNIESYSNMLNWVPPLKDISTDGFRNSPPPPSSSYFTKIEDNSFCVGATTPMCSQPLHQTTSIVDSLLSNLVDPQQVPFSFQTSLNISDHHEMSQFPIVNQMNNNNNNDDNDHNNNSLQVASQWGGLSSPDLLPPLSRTDTTSSLTSNNVAGEASGASSYGRGSSCPWEEIVLDEAIVNDISC